MPYPSGHRPVVKKAIIESARKLFNRHGFECVSIHQIMAGAGLTHGGFYSYFNSKSDLYAEVLTCFFTDPNWKSCWEGVKVDLSSGASILKTWRTPAPWLLCPLTLRAAAKLPGPPSRPSSDPWSAYWSAACPRMAALAAPLHKVLLRYVSAGWSLPAPSSIAISAMNCATPACPSPSILAAGLRHTNRKTENPRRPPPPPADDPTLRQWHRLEPMQAAAF